MSNLRTPTHTIENPLVQGINQVLRINPIRIDQESGELWLSQATEWIENIMADMNSSPLLGFESSIRYDQAHIDLLAVLLKQMVESAEYRRSGNFPQSHIRTWQELQGKVLLEQLGKEIEPIAGDVLMSLENTRTHIWDLMEKPGLSSMAKAGIAAGSFGIMWLFQYRFLESLFQAIAQHDISQEKSWAMVQLVQNHSAMLGAGIGWSVMTACAFAYLVKEWFETHLSDKLHGTNRKWKKILCAVACAGLLGIEMTGSFSRITIGTDLKEQVVDMKKGVAWATEGDKTVFVALDKRVWGLVDMYETEWKALFDAEAQRGGVGPYAAAKQAAYLPKSQIDWSKVDRIPGLRQKVEALFTTLEWHRNKMKEIQANSGIQIQNSTKETAAPVVLGATGYHVDRVAQSLNAVSTEAVDELLASHNLVDPSLADVIMDLVFDAGKKLHPRDVNELRTVLDRQIDKSGKNVDALTDELWRTIDTLDAYMRDMTESANAAYKSQTTYVPKPKPDRIDTSGLKDALNSTKVPVSVLDPFGVWGKFIELTGDGTIPAGYSLVLILRVLLVEGVLLGIGMSRVRQTRRSLSTPGARFEDLSRETDGQYLKIIALIERLTGGEAWKMLNGKALTQEEIHTLISSTLASQKSQSALWNQMSVVDLDGKTINSQAQKLRDLLGAAFFWQYSAPEIRRLHQLDKSLTFWQGDIAGVDTPPSMSTAWMEKLRSLVSVVPKRWPKSDTGDTEPYVDNGWEIPVVGVLEGAHAVQGQIMTVLNGKGSLKTLSDATAKRLANEIPSDKRRQYESARISLKTYIDSNPHLMSVVSIIRWDSSHPLHAQVRVLDETGDIFGYYRDELKAVDARIKTLMVGQDEKTFYVQRDRFIRKTGDALKSKLAILRDSWLLNTEEKRFIWEALNLSNPELMTEANITYIQVIITSRPNSPYITRTFPQWWGWTPELNYGRYISELWTIDAKVQELQELQSRRRTIEEYTTVSPDNVTELQIMGLRNATAQIKSHLESKKQ